MPPGESERLVLAAQVLEATGPGPIDTVTLVDPIGDFPVLWLKALEKSPFVSPANLTHFVLLSKENATVRSPYNPV